MKGKLLNCSSLGDNMKIQLIRKNGDSYPLATYHNLTEFVQLGYEGLEHFRKYEFYKEDYKDKEENELHSDCYYFVFALLLDIAIKYDEHQNDEIAQIHLRDCHSYWIKNFSYDHFLKMVVALMFMLHHEMIGLPFKRANFGDDIIKVGQGYRLLFITDEKKEAA